MNKFKPLLLLFILFLFLIKGFFFVITLKLTEEVKLMEKSIQKLKEENISLEKEVSRLDSYQLISSSAGELGFTKNAQLIPLDNLGIAYKN